VATVKQSFRYRVRAGDGQTRWHSVTAIDRPALANVRLRVVAPEYVDRPKYEKSYIPDRIRALQGSRLTLELRPEATLDRLELILTGDQNSGETVEEQTLTLVADADGWYRFETILEQTFSLSPALHGPHGLRGSDRQVCTIHVIPDKAPVARVISPTDELSVNPDEVVEIIFEAHDDHGIAAAELVVYDESPTKEGKPPEILSIEQIPLGDQQWKKHVLATAWLDLAKYDFDGGANISYAVRVTDNRVRRGDPKAELAEGSSTNRGTSARGSESSPTELNSTNPVLAAKAGKANAKPAPEPGASKTGSAVKSTSNKPSVPPDPALQPANTDSAPGNNSVPTTDAGTTDAGNKDKSAGKNEPSTVSKTGNRNKNIKGDPNSGDPDSTPTNKQKSDKASDNKKPGAVAATNNEAKAGNPDDPTPASGAKNTPLNASADPAEPKSPDAANTTKTSIAQTLGKPTNNDQQVAKSDAARATPRDRTPDQPADQDAEPRAGQDPVAVTNSADSSESTPQSKQSRMAEVDVQRGQNSESNRLRLKVRKRTTAVAQARGDRRTIQMRIRERLEKIDRQLKAAEAVLLEIDTQLKQTGESDEHARQLEAVDVRLAAVERIIGELRNESKETPFAFAGLQMVNIGRANITPARDRVFFLIRQPDAKPDPHVLEALQNVSRARELLAALLVRYDKVTRDQELAKSLEEAVKIYEVYIENMQRLMRQARQNRNPLQRKMAIVEVDEAYLKRLKETLEMRSDLMAEFGRILADDPRLLSKYMDLIKRRQSSLRNDLTELRERQEEISDELRGWRRVGQPQRDDLWLLVVELRLLAAAPISKDASRLQERTVAQMPLGLDPSHGTPALILEHVRQIALQARANANDAQRRIRQATVDESKNSDLVTAAEALSFRLAELNAALEQLDFEGNDEETTEFVLKRLAESRALAERAVAWAETAASIQQRQYHSLAQVDQQQLAMNTEQLRIAMLEIEPQLGRQFPDGEAPAAVLAIARELMQVMESVTFNQTAATYAFDRNQLENAETQQTLAMEGFERAEELFDKMRRMVIEELDKIDPDDPNIADLVDPTLDEFLEQLEREPNLNALIGIPNRPRNLKVISDWLLWQEQSGDALIGAADEAAQSARARAMEEKRIARTDDNSEEDPDMSEAEWLEVAKAEEIQETLEQKIQELRKQAADPETDEEEKQKILKMAKQLEALRESLGKQQIDEKEWKKLVESDQMKAVIKALANGEPLPDNQWNTILSSLDKGLWQVRGRTPPEDYRKAIEQYQDQIRRLLNAEDVD
jgi:hypothetical protein